MASKLGLSKKYIWLLVLFVASSTAFLVMRTRQKDDYVDFNLVEGANVLLFVLTLISFYMHKKATASADPKVFSRMIMSTMMMKMFALAIAALIYIVLAKSQRNVPGILIALVLYVFYAFVDTRSSMKTLKEIQKNA